MQVAHERKAAVSKQQVIAVLLAVVMTFLAFTFSVEAGISFVGAAFLEWCKTFVQSKERTES